MIHGADGVHDAFRFGPDSTATVTLPSNPDAGDFVTVPDAALMFGGTYLRAGRDLVITDGSQRVVVADYFASEKRVSLLSPDGAVLTADVVDSLAGPLARGQYAQATPTPPAQAIGRVETVSGNATVMRANGTTAQLNNGDFVFRGDVVQTGAASTLGISLADGSAFNLTANARMVLNDLVYDPNGSNNSALVNLVQGTISFVAGKVAKTGDMRVDTPVATMGIRGTAVLVEISSVSGPTKFSVMVEPDGTVGSFQLFDKANPSVLLATVSSSGTAWVITPVAPLQVVAAEVAKSPAELQAQLAVVQQVFQVFYAGQQSPLHQTPVQGPPQTPDPAPNPNPTPGGNGSGSPPTNTPPGDNNGQQNNGKTGQGPTTGTVTVTSADTNETGIKTATITIALIDDAPLAGSTTLHTTEKADLSLNLFAGGISAVAKDPEGAQLTLESLTIDGVTYKIGANYVPGTALAFSAGIVRFTADGGIQVETAGHFDALAAGETLVRTIGYTVSDGKSSATGTIEVTVEGRNDAPTLAPAALAAVVEDANPPGQTIAALFAGKFADIDHNAHLAGIVVVANAANAASEGQWQYSTDGGAHWSAVGAVSGAAGLALSADALIRFLPAANYNGAPPGLSVHALDDSYAGAFSAGDAHVLVDTSAAGGTSALSAASATLTTDVEAANDAGTVAVTGTATENEVLTAHVSDAEGFGSPVLYQWQRSYDGVNWTDISVSSTSSYTLSDGDVGAFVRVKTSYLDGTGVNEVLISDASARVENVNNLGIVALAGQAAEHRMLTALVEDPDGLTGVAIAYQWQRSGDGVHWNDIAGAAGQSYTLDNADVGNHVRVQVAYTDAHGTFESFVSAASDEVININQPGTAVVTGTPQENAVLTAHVTDADGFASPIFYQWQRSYDGLAWTDVSVATTPAYVLDDADVGAVIRVKTSYFDANGTSEVLTSGATQLIENVNNPGTVSMTGTARTNESLTALVEDLDTISGPISYQWQRSKDGAHWTDVAGADGQSYELGISDIGLRVRVSVSYTDAHGTAEAFASAATKPVAGGPAAFDPAGSGSPAAAEAPSIVSVGTEGQDTFHFNFGDGHQSILGFSTTDGDVVDIAGVIAEFADLNIGEHPALGGGVETVINLGNNQSITLNGVHATDLNANNIHLVHANLT